MARKKNTEQFIKEAILVHGDKMNVIQKYYNK